MENWGRREGGGGPPPQQKTKKTLSPDGTARASVWERRKLPGLSHGPTERSGLCVLRKLDTAEKRQQRLLARAIERHERIPRRLALACVAQDGIGERQGSTVVQELAPLRDLP